MVSNEEKVLGYRVEARAGQRRPKATIRKFLDNEINSLKTVESCLEEYPKKIQSLEQKCSKLSESQQTKGRSANDIAIAAFNIATKITPEIANLKYRTERMPEQRDAHIVNIAKLRDELAGYGKRKAEEDTADSKMAPPPMKKAKSSTPVQPISFRRVNRNANIRRTTVWVPKAAVASTSPHTLNNSGASTPRDIAAASPTPSSRSGASANKKRKADDDDDDDDDDDEEEEEEVVEPPRPRKAAKKQAPRADFSQPEEESETDEDSADDLGGVPDLAGKAPTCPVMASGAQPEGDGGDSSFSSFELPSTGATTPEVGSSVSSDEKKKSKVLGRDRINLSGKGVARPVNKRRPAASNINGATSASVKKASRVSAKKRFNLNGLVNHRDSCFSAVAIQLLDAALDENNLDELLGEYDEELETFNMSDKDCRQFDKTIYHDAGPDKKLKNKQKLLRDAIKAAAKAGETEKISAAKHLRSLLDDLRGEYRGTADRHASPYLFQSVMAFGAAEETNRAEMSGDVQHDSFEHFQSVLDTLCEDPHVANSNGLQELFEVETKAQDVCENIKCDHESAYRTASSNYHNVNVPHGDASKTADFRGMLRSSMKSRRDDACPKCGEKTLVTKTTFTKLPDNIVMRVNRTAFNQKARAASKVATTVNLGIDRPVKLGEERFEIAAVVRHDGDSVTCGHYTIFRKLGENWFLLNDKECTPKAASDVRDHGRNGKCAMLLLKKVKSQDDAK